MQYVIIINTAFVSTTLNIIVEWSLYGPIDNRSM